MEHKMEHKMEHQIANIVNIVSQILKENDIHSKGNIIGDKTIYAKEGLFVGDYNPNYDFFIKGRGCITGDLIIKGNLFYENTGESVNKNYIDVYVKPNKSTGFRIRDDISVKGFIWDSQEEEFIFGDEQFIENIKPRQANYLNNIRFKNANFNNGYCKNLLVENSIIGINEKIKLDSDLIINGNVKIKGNIYSTSDMIYIKNQMTTKTLNVEGSIFVDSTVEIGKEMSCYELKTNRIDCSDINGHNAIFEGEIKIKGECEIGGYFISSKGGEFKAGLEVKGNIYLGKNLIFTGDESGIAFTTLSNIENASVSFINGKKVSTYGEVIVSNAVQDLSNKSLGSNLDAKNFKICNLENPVDSHDAVNKKYVDQYITSGHILEPVKISTNCNIDCVFMTINYQLVSKEMEKLVIDKIEADIGDRILVKNQKNKVENGIYIVISKGHKNQQWILQLADDWTNIIKNRPNLTPMVMCRYGAENGKKLFGLNIVYLTIWEIMDNEEFIKKGWTIYEQLLADNKELKTELKRILDMRSTT
jgi:hypothetical protein